MLTIYVRLPAVLTRRMRGFASRCLIGLPRVVANVMTFRNLYGAKLVQGERSTKQKTQFFRFVLPNRSLSYEKLVQGERSTKQKTQFLHKSGCGSAI